MTAQDWDDPSARCVAVYLDGSDAPDRDEHGDVLLRRRPALLVNGWSEPVDFVLPETRPGATWTVELDSRAADDRRRLQARRGPKARSSRCRATRWSSCAATRLQPWMICGYSRSMIIAMPWPPPTHMVSRP